MGEPARPGTAPAPEGSGDFPSVRVHAPATDETMQQDPTHPPTGGDPDAAEMAALRARLAALEAENARLSQALQASEVVGTWDWDVPADRVVANARFASLYGVDPAAALRGGVSIAEYLAAIHPEDRPRVEAAITRALRQGGEYSAEYRLTPHGDPACWVLARGRCQFDATGGPVRFSGVVVDITERKHTEAALRESQARLAAELQAMSGLHELGTRLLDAPDVATAAREVLDAVIALAGADRGTMQVYEPALEGLRFVAQHGFDQLALDAIGVICADFHSTCARALRSGAHVVVEDFRTDPDAMAHRPTADALGYRAALSTPLRSRGGEILGMLTMHFREPHSPDERESRLIDLYARQAAHLMERARAEAMLRESEARWRGLFESMHEGFGLGEVVYGPDGRAVDIRFLEVNAAFERQSGLSAAAVIGRSVTEAVPGLEPFWIETYARVAETGKPAHVEHYAAPLGRWFEIWSYRPEPGRFATLFLDITERKAAREALAESEARFRAIVEQLGAGLAQCDGDGRFLLVNERYCEIVGRPREELLNGLRMQDITHPDDLAANLPAFARAFHDGVPFAIEKRYLRPDGAEVWVSNSIAPVRDSGGQVTAVVAVAQDITARRAVEAALAEGEARLRDLLATLDLGASMIRDLDGSIRFWSEGCARLYGWTAAEAVGQDTHALLRTAFPVPRAEIEAALERDGEWTGDLRQWTRDGRELVVSARKLLRRGLDGRPMAILESLTDVTAQRRAGEERRAVEAERDRATALLRAFIEAVPGVVFAKDRAGRMLLANEGTAALIGKRPEEFIGRTDAEFLADKEQAEAVMANDRRIMENGVAEQVEEPVSQPDGTPAIWLSTKAPWRDGSGAVVGLVGASVDITERLVAEAALAESEARLRAVLDNVPVGVVLAEAPSGRILFGNPAMEQVFRHPMIYSGGVGDYREWEAYDADGRRVESHEYPLARVLATGEPAQGEYHYACGDGVRRWISVAGAPIRGRDGRMTGAVIVTADIDDQKRAAEVLVRDKAELERLVEARTAALLRAAEERRRAEEAARQSEKLAALGQLTGGVAHDFGNILQVVSSGVSLLRRPAMAEERRAAILDGILQATRNARDLTRRLLAFARQQPLAPEMMDLNARLASMSELLRHTLGRGIRVETDLAPDLWPVLADPGQFEVALLNLAINARDAMPEGGRLTLQARNVVLPATAEHAAGEYVCLSVKDTGQGMPPAVLARIFEPFFTTKEVGKGTGLGLAQVFGFVRQSGGDVRTESEPGQGTAVILHLPRFAAEAAQEEAAPGGAVLEALRSSEGRVVLVVEDNAVAGDFAAALLEELGYMTKRAGNAAEALALLADGERVDAVFSDVVMPGGIDGIELAGILRASYPHLPVVLTSGYSARLAEGDAPGGVETLAKPYQLGELAAALGRALHHRLPAESAEGAEAST